MDSRTEKLLFIVTSLLCLLRRYNCAINSSYITANNFSLSFDELYNIKPLNCISFIPPEVLALMVQYSQSVPNNDTTYDQMIPTNYLQTCLLNSDYDSRISALYFMQRPRFTFGFGLNQVVSLTSRYPQQCGDHHDDVE